MDKDKSVKSKYSVLRSRLSLRGEDFKIKSDHQDQDELQIKAVFGQIIFFLGNEQFIKWKFSGEKNFFSSM